MLRRRKRPDRPATGAYSTPLDPPVFQGAYRPAPVGGPWRPAPPWRGNRFGRPARGTRSAPLDPAVFKGAYRPPHWRRPIGPLKYSWV